MENIYLFGTVFQFTITLFEKVKNVIQIYVPLNFLIKDHLTVADPERIPGCIPPPA